MIFNCRSLIHYNHTVFTACATHVGMFHLCMRTHTTYSSLNSPSCAPPSLPHSLSTTHAQCVSLFESLVEAVPAFHASTPLSEFYRVIAAFATAAPPQRAYAIARGTLAALAAQVEGASDARAHALRVVASLVWDEGGGGPVRLPSGEGSVLTDKVCVCVHVCVYVCVCVCVCVCVWERV